ncbi:MbnP family protein [Deinococcus lacus]|uniref:MbnP family protein n=1 Tax=Deinococcus lacus TaxID=392561 RepID=A0ABW1Y9I8_9DEIO
MNEVKFYVSNVALVRADGSEVPVRGLSLAKLPGSGQSSLMFRGQAPAGEYRGLRFDVGVPRDLNHRDASAARGPLSIEEGMYWAWNSGYIFFSLLGKSEGQAIANHVGGDNHRVTVNLADLQKPGTALTLGAGGLDMPVSLDLQKLYARGVSGEAWDFSKATYQQVHMGAAADQLAANLAGAFSAGGGTTAPAGHHP